MGLYSVSYTTGDGGMSDNGDMQRCITLGRHCQSESMGVLN
jgi:hypothetical protein